MMDDELKIWKEMFDNIPPENVIRLSRKDMITFLRAVDPKNPTLPWLTLAEAWDVFKDEIRKPFDLALDHIAVFIARNPKLLQFCDMLPHVPWWLPWALIFVSGLLLPMHR